MFRVPDWFLMAQAKLLAISAGCRVVLRFAHLPRVLLDGIQPGVFEVSAFLCALRNGLRSLRSAQRKYPFGSWRRDYLFVQDAS